MNNMQTQRIVKDFTAVIKQACDWHEKGLYKDAMFYRDFVAWQTTSILLLERVTPRGSVLGRLIQQLADEMPQRITNDHMNEYIGHLRAMKDCFINGFLNYTITQPE